MNKPSLFEDLSGVQQLTIDSNAMAAAMRERQRHFLQLAAENCATWFDAEGHLLPGIGPLETRELFWLCFALMQEGQAKLASRIVQAAELQRDHLGNPRPWKFDIFHSNIAVALLVAHGAKFEAPARARLEDLTRDSFGSKPGNRQPDYQFHGFNDNMPAKATMGLILGGELLDYAPAVEHGLWNLRQFARQLSRCDINSEWNSPTYTPLTLHALGEVAAHARHPEAVELALALENRLWQDLAARFHAGLGTLAGPYARAYQCDLLAHLSNAATLLWFAVGEAASPSPLKLFGDCGDLMLHHDGNWHFNVAQMCWLAAGHYHIPNWALEQFGRDKTGLTVGANFETGDMGPDFPERQGRIRTFLGRNHAVGTTSTPALSGENGPLYSAVYARCLPVTSHRDLGTIYSHFAVDEELPGQAVPGVPEAEKGAASGRSNGVTLGYRGTVLALTHPQLALAGSSGGDPRCKREAVAISHLREMLIFPAHFGRVQEVISGGEPREEWGGEVPPGVWVALHCGELLVGVRMLGYALSGSACPVSLGSHGNYQWIACTFYHGPARVFSRQELRGFYGGFLVEHAPAAEFADLASFAAALGKGRVSDHYWFSRRVRYLRPALGGEDAMEMDISWSPGSCAARYATVNGVPDTVMEAWYPGREERGSCPGGSRGSELALPWTKLEVAWADWPGRIGHSG